jgi:hypothetical protein
MKLTTHLHLFLRLRMVDLCLRFSIRLLGIVLNYLSTGTSLPFTLPYWEIITTHKILVGNLLQNLNSNSPLYEYIVLRNKQNYGL